jgi:hypothetical protein
MKKIITILIVSLIISCTYAQSNESPYIRYYMPEDFIINKLEGKTVAMFKHPIRQGEISVGVTSLIFFTGFVVAFNNAEVDDIIAVMMAFRNNQDESFIFTAKTSYSNFKYAKENNCNWQDYIKDNKRTHFFIDKVKK